jgi:hypothetical protein
VWTTALAGALCAARAARTQVPQPYDDGCAVGKWQDAIRHEDAGLIKCRQEFVDNYVHQMSAPAAKGFQEFVVDPIALTTRGKVAIALGRKPIRIRVINLNPYLYSYQISLKQVAVVETAPLDFFKALLPSLPTLTPPPTNAVADLLPVTPSCSQHPNPVLAALASEARGLVSNYREIRLDVDALQDLQGEIRAEETTIHGQQSVTDAIQRAALRGIADLSDYTAGINPTIAAITSFHNEVDALVARAPSPLPAGNCDASELATAVPILKRADKEAVAVATKLAANRDDSAAQLEKERQSLGMPLLEPTNFYWIRDVQAGQSQVDSITVQRRSATVARDAKDPPFTTVMVATTRIGLPRLFTIGGGIAYFPTLYRSFAATKRYTGSAVGGDTVVSIVNEQAYDTRRISPMLTLGAMLPIDQVWRQTFFSGIGIQLGTTVSKDATTALEYFAGGSVSLLDSRVFVAYGGYAAKEAELADGLLVGARIPATQAAPPTTTHTRWRTAWMFGFRFY